MVKSVFLKRMMDITVSSLALLLSAPITILVSLAVLATIDRPIFFCQQRAGKDGEPFTIYKFRTMRDARDAGGNPLPDGERITRLGQFLRSTTIDEVPEFFNVLKGDMSLVGPRPLLLDYVSRYTPEQGRRLEVKPGMTGPTAVRGRNLLSWSEKFALDTWYVDNQSIWLDIKIMFQTLGVVLRRKGVSAEGHATMPYFEGERE